MKGSSFYGQKISVAGLVIGLIVGYTITTYTTTTKCVTKAATGAPSPGQMSDVRPKSLRNSPLVPEPVLERHGTEGYLVYDCSHRFAGLCGGWSDRLTGIYCTYVLAILTNRRFLINFDKPCQFDNYFEPKSYAWRYNSTLLGKKPFRYYDMIDGNSKKIINVLLTANSTKPIKDFFTGYVSFVRINYDLTQEFRKFHHVENYLPWITRLHFADINHYIFDLFLQPKRFVLDILDTVTKGRRTNTTFCAHVRLGKSSTLPTDVMRKNNNIHAHVVLDFIQTIDKSKNDIFLATDSNNIRQQVETTNPGIPILTVPGTIVHIDRQKIGDDKSCEGFQKQLLDFLFLRTCDKLVICESGFSIMAAYWRDTSEGLYCWTPYTVVPCSRYTVYDFFPRPLLGPPR